MVEKEFDKEFILLNKALENFKSFDGIHDSHHCTHIGHSILALYLLAGSDYLSNFFGITCETMIMTYAKYIDYISPALDPLVTFKHGVFTSVNHIAFLRLLCCIYLEKYKRLTSHIASSPVELFDTFKRASSNIGTDLKALLEWLSYDATDLKSKNVEITNIEQFCAFTRRVGFFMNHGSKNLYNMILPSDNAIKFHCLRGTYIMKLVFDEDPCSACIHDYESYGWLSIGDTIHTIWDENFEEEEKNLNKKRQLPISKCSCKTGCNSDKCKNCSKACRPCSIKCVCKGVCKNPHNNNGKCSKCKDEVEEVDQEDIVLEEADGDMVEEMESMVFDDQATYFNKESSEFISIPDKNNTDTDSDPELSDTYISDDSDVEYLDLII